MENLMDLADRIVELASQCEIKPFFHGPIPDSRLIEAERRLGVNIAGSFRGYLLYHGAANILGYMFDGLPQVPQPENACYYYNSIIDNTEEFRSFMEELPRSFVSITSDGGDITYWIDTSIIENDESPIIAHFYGIYVKVSDSFLEFVDLLTHPEDLYTLLNSASKENIDKVELDSRLSDFEPSQQVTRRTISWLQIIPDPCPSDLPPLAQHFGIDLDTREVFVYAASAGLNAEQQLEAIANNAGFYADPTKSGGFQHSYVSIDYIIDHFPFLPQVPLLPQLKQVVLNAHDEK